MHQWDPWHKINARIQRCKKLSYWWKTINTHDIKHNDHCHFTGKYCGLAHQGFKVNNKGSHVIPIVSHNSPG